MNNALPLEPWAWVAGVIAVRIAWQGTLVALFAAGALAILQNRAANVRYAVGCVALFIFAALLPANLLLAPDFTEPEMSGPYSTYPPVEAYSDTGPSSLIPVRLAETVSPQKPVLPQSSILAVPREARPRAFAPAWYEASLPWIGALWWCGMAIFALYDFLGLLAVARLRGRGEEAPAAFVARAELVRQHIGVRMSVPIRVVEGISTAMVTGIFRVVILVPAAMVSGMSPEFVDAVLAHEFAHLRRWDRWINLLQCILETLLFFHPGLWWLSRRVRIERELCCDDLALGVCPDRARYVHALLSLSESTASCSAAVFSSHGGNFALRVRHILGFPATPRYSRREAGSMSVLAVAGVALFVVAWSRLSRAEEVGSELRFSDLRTLGTVQARWEDAPRPVATPWLTTYTSGWTVLDEARGHVKVPKGAQVKLSIAKTDLSGLESLPPDAIYFLDARYRDLTDRDIAPIAHLTGLRALDLGENLYNLHGPGLAALGTLQNLEWLNLHGSPLDSLPQDTIRRFTHLRYLAGIFKEHSAVVLRETTSLNELQFLSMKSGGPISPEDLAALSGKSSLRGLALYKMGLNDDALRVLRDLPHLEYLNLSENPLGDQAMATIGQLQGLRHLDLHTTHVSDAGLAYLRTLASLETINLSDTSVTERGLASFSALPRLYAVNLIDTPIPETRVTAFTRGIGQRGMVDVPVQTSSNPDAPRVGIFMSHATRTGPTMPDFLYGHYTYGNQESTTLASALNEANFDVYAVLEPETEQLGELPLILRETGLAMKVIDATDEDAMLRLDAVLTCTAYNIPEAVLDALAHAVTEGVGLVTIGAFGDSLPGTFDPGVTALTGLENPQFVSQGCQDATVTVHTTHPLLGTEMPGRAYNVRTLLGATSPVGVADGEVLLDAPPEYPPNFPALYVREFGAGRIVRAQWHHPMQPGLPFPGHTLYVRALNWVAHRDVESVW